VHGISDEDVARAPLFAEIAGDLAALLGDAVFVAHNASFDLGMLRHAFEREAVAYRPVAVACTLKAFRLLEPLADNHRLQSICDRRGVVLADAHDAMSDVCATVALLRVILDEGLAPETVELDHGAYMRLRSRGDTRPASEPQIRRVYGLARSAGLVLPDGSADRAEVAALVERVAGSADLDALTRAQVQDVYDELDALIERQPALAPAVSL
jgi:DNA polymerase III epsilon subunit-like protein